MLRYPDVEILKSLPLGPKSAILQREHGTALSQVTKGIAGILINPLGTLCLALDSGCILASRLVFEVTPMNKKKKKTHKIFFLNEK